MMRFFRKRLVTKDNMYDQVLEDTFKTLESYGVDTEEFRDAYYCGTMSDEQLFRLVSIGIPNDLSSPSLSKILTDIKFYFDNGNKQYSLYNLISLVYMMNHQGLKVNLLSDKSFFNVVSYNLITNSVNIQEKDASWTSIHELGHAIHANLRKKRIPKQYYKALLEAKINLFKKKEDVPELVSYIRRGKEFYSNIVDKRMKENCHSDEEFKEVIDQLENMIRNSATDVSTEDIVRVMESRNINSSMASYIKGYLLDKVRKKSGSREELNFTLSSNDVLANMDSINSNCLLYSDFLSGLIGNNVIKNKYNLKEKFDGHDFWYYLDFKNVFFELFANYNVCCCSGGGLDLKFEQYFGNDLLKSVQEVYDWKKFENNKDNIENMEDVDIQFLRALLPDITKDELDSYNDFLFDSLFGDFLGALSRNLGDDLGKCRKVLAKYYFTAEVDEELSLPVRESLKSLNKAQIRKIIFEKLETTDLSLSKDFYFERQNSGEVIEPEYVGKELLSLRADEENVIENVKAYDCYEDIFFRKYKIVRSNDDVGLKIADIVQVFNNVVSGGNSIKNIRNVVLFDEDFLDNKIENDTLYIYKNSSVDEVVKIIEEKIKGDKFSI